MLGILRLAAGSLFLILTVLFLTAAAQQEQQAGDAPKKEDSPSSGRWTFTESPVALPHQQAIKDDGAIKKETRFLFFAEQPENALVSPKKSVETDAETSEAGEPEAQTAPERSPYRARRGAVEYNFEAGIAPFDPTHFTGEKTYNTTGRKLGTLNFRKGYVWGTAKGITFTYLWGVTPLVVARANEVRNPAYVSPTATPGVLPTKRETSYGFGGAPGNFRFTFFPSSRVKPFAQAGAGIVFFNKPLPIPESRRLQFTGDYGGGFIVHLENPKQFMIFGYKYFHLSNGNIGGKRWNPGYNANTFYIAFSFFK